MADRFYVNCALAPGPVALAGAEAHHLAGVRRLRPGDAVCLFNGDGREYPACVTAVEKHRVLLDVVGAQSPERELPFALAVAAPLPKGDRGQFLVEKLTELGVAAYVPLRTARSVVHPGEGKHEKLQRTVIEASKQCGRNRLLVVEPVTDWASYCARASLPPRRWLGEPGADPAPRELARSDTVIAVGPEGGWTEEERALAKRTGWQGVGLGNRILRIETAAVALVVQCAMGGLGLQG